MFQIGAIKCRTSIGSGLGLLMLLMSVYSFETRFERDPLSTSWCDNWQTLSTTSDGRTYVSVDILWSHL
jgi:hypothetical protein